MDAISLVLDQGFTIAEAARSLEIRPNMLGLWIKWNEADNNGQAFRGNGKLTPEQEVTLEFPPLNGHIKFCLKEKKDDTKLQTCLPAGLQPTRNHGVRRSVRITATPINR